MRSGGRVVNPWPHGQLQGMRKRRIRKEKRRGQKVVFLRKEKKRKKGLSFFFFPRWYFRSFQQRMDQTGKQLFFSFHFFSFIFLSFFRGEFFFSFFIFPFFEVMIIGAGFFLNFLI